MRTLIGVTGRKRAGKDSVADVLVRDHGFVRVGFADALKRMALAIDPIIPGLTDQGPVVHVRLSVFVSALGWERAKDKLPEVRRFLQRLGTEGVRDLLGADTWVDLWAAEASKHDRVVVPDVRFPNEADWFRPGGPWLPGSPDRELWRVVRGGASAGDLHLSETALDHWPATVEMMNTGTLTDLEDMVYRALGARLSFVGPEPDTDPSSPWAVAL